MLIDYIEAIIVFIFSIMLWPFVLGLAVIIGSLLSVPIFIAIQAGLITEEEVFTFIGKILAFPFTLAKLVINGELDFEILNYFIMLPIIFLIAVISEKFFNFLDNHPIVKSILIALGIISPNCYQTCQY